jgi:hypothetical protein
MEAWALKVHGACAMAFLFVLGWILDPHVVANWSASRNRTSGGALTAAVALLAGSGYGLYYFGGETLRSLTEWIHSILGLLSLPLLAWHVLRGRRPRAPRA